MNLTIHRGTKEIGGSCVELQSKNSRILLDFGMPLVDDNGDPFNDRNIIKQSKEELIEQGILPAIEGALKGQEPTIDAILLSHPHQDHYGLLSYINPNIPIFMSEGCKALVEVSVFFEQTSYSPDNVKTVEPWKPFQIGDFTITPYLVDHSGFDAFSYLIESNTKKVFYSGDFRAHGRKSVVFDNLIKRPPKEIDYLILEGTMINRDNGKNTTEQDIEEALVKQFKTNDNLFFIACSSQNIDRLVSIYRACKRSGRTFVIDPYTAFILDKAKNISENIPQYNWGENIKVFFVPNSYTDKLAEKKLLYKYKSAKITFKEMLQIKNKLVIKDLYLTRKIFANNGTLDDASLIFSMWEGYLEDSETEKFWSKHNVPLVQIHCSGHAYIADLQKLAKALNPKHVIPIHTFHPEKFIELFDNVRLFKDSETIEL